MTHGGHQSHLGNQKRSQRPETWVLGSFAGGESRLKGGLGAGLDPLVDDQRPSKSSWKGQKGLSGPLGSGEIRACSNQDSKVWAPDPSSIQLVDQEAIKVILA